MCLKKHDILKIYTNIRLEETHINNDYKSKVAYVCNENR